MFLSSYSLLWWFSGVYSVNLAKDLPPRIRGDGHATTYAVYNIQRTVKKKSIPPVPKGGLELSRVSRRCSGSERTASPDRSDREKHGIPKLKTLKPIQRGISFF